MKNSTKMLQLLLTIALLVSIPPYATSEVITTKNETMESIFNRASVRAYTQQVVEQEKVELLLRAAMAAPTAVNKQPWAFVVITERAILDSLALQLPNARMLKQANLAIVVCGDMNKALLDVSQAYWVQDCSAATQNLLLAAHSLGLGAVWTGVFPRAERVAMVRKVLNMPEHLVPLNVIPVGYPADKNRPKDKWNPSVVYQNSFQ